MKIIVKCYKKGASNYLNCHVFDYLEGRERRVNESYLHT